MHAKKGLRLIGAVAIALLLPACMPDAEGPITPTGPSLTHEPDTGVRLQYYFTIDGCANPGDPAGGPCYGYRNLETRYTWEVTKTASLASLALNSGASGTVGYDIVIQRMSLGDFDVYGVRGDSCLRNLGTEPTDGLTITQIVYTWDDALGDWVPFGEDNVDVSSHPILYPWDFSVGTDEDGMPSYTCYPYDVDMGDTPPVPNPTYGSVEIGIVTVTNFHPNFDEPVMARAFFTFPDAPTALTESGASAVLVDELTCATGFTCSALPLELSAPLTLTGSTTFAIATEVHNPGVACDTRSTLTNRATLTLESGATVHSEASTIVDGQECGAGGDGGGEDPTDPGFIQACTQGFWKQSQHFEHWVTYAPTGLTGGAFSNAALLIDQPKKGTAKALSDYTMLQALQFPGGAGTVGAAKILLRAATATLLNRTYSGASITALQTAVNDALASNNRKTIIGLAEQLDKANNTGACTIS